MGWVIPYFSVQNDGSCAYLAVVKCPADRQVVDVLVEDGRHLSFLDRRDSALRKENEDGYIGFVAQAVDSSTSRVTTGGTDNSELLGRLFGSFSGIASIEKVFEEVPDELECKVFECVGGPMEQFEDVCFRIELDKGCDGWIAKRGRANGVCPVDEPNEIGWGKLIGRDEN